MGRLGTWGRCWCRSGAETARAHVASELVLKVDSSVHCVRVDILNSHDDEILDSLGGGGDIMF